jgi:HD-GYP domain-containing protein (c-di-GMP phosphodiesterase class II)
MLRDDARGAGALATGRREKQASPAGGAGAGLDRLVAVAEDVERRERVEARHSRAVAAVGHALALELGLDGRAASLVYLAGLVHDVGKMGVPGAVLRKPARLDADEWALIRAIPLRGADLVAAFGDPLLAPIVAALHERWDGGGYPAGLAGEAAPPEARVLAVANALVSMAGARPFRPARPAARAVEEVRRGRRSRYDPEVVSAALELAREGRLALGDEAVPALALRH